VFIHYISSLWLLPCIVVFITHFLNLELISGIMVVKLSKGLLGGVNFLREDLLELLRSSLLDGVGNLGGTGGVADLAGLVV
jgi:hypothetical protein